MFFEAPGNIDFAAYADDKTLYTYFSNIKKCASQSTRDIRKNVSLVSNKFNCRRMSPFKKNALKRP